MSALEECESCGTHYVVSDEYYDRGMCVTCQVDEDAFNSWASHEFGDK